MASPKDKAEQILMIVKRKHDDHHGHHGGAWKLAYADFVTAMMAFFLLMWLLASTQPSPLAGNHELYPDPLGATENTGGPSPNSVPNVNPGKGGGATQENSGVKSNEDANQSSMFDVATASLTSELEQQDKEDLEELKKKIEQAIETIPEVSQFKEQIMLQITEEGLQIEIIDAENRPMFALGSSVIQDHMKGLLSALVPLLSSVDNKVSIVGHTDSKVFAGNSSGYGNYELSADRAGATRRQLVKFGFESNRISRVTGMGSSTPLVPDDTEDASNRRITVVVMSKLDQLKENFNTMMLRFQE